MNIINQYFEYSYREGCTRWMEEDRCIYIPTAVFKEMLLKDLQLYVVSS